MKWNWFGFKDKEQLEKHETNTIIHLTWLTKMGLKETHSIIVNVWAGNIWR